MPDGADLQGARQLAGVEPEAKAQQMAAAVVDVGGAGDAPAANALHGGEGFVQGVEEASAKAGVTATPTMKVNGKTIDLATLPDDVNQLKQFIADAAKAQ